MADDNIIKVKVSIFPFLEVDDKHKKLYFGKDVGLKKPKNLEFAADFTVTTKKWDQRKIQAALRALFRYDLSLLATQVWQSHGEIAKAKNGQDKMKAKKAFIDSVPKLIKAMRRVLDEKLEEAVEDVKSGAADDSKELKGTRKSLSAGLAGSIADQAEDFLSEFYATYSDLEDLKSDETRATGEEKTPITEELNEKTEKHVGKHSKLFAKLAKNIDRNMKTISSIPNAMKKSMGKEMSDLTKAEYKTSMDELNKMLKPADSAVSRLKKDMKACFAKLARKDISNSTYNLISEAVEKLYNETNKLESTMQDIDGRLKKLEKVAKKR